MRNASRITIKRRVRVLRAIRATRTRNAHPVSVFTARRPFELCTWSRIVWIIVTEMIVPYVPPTPECTKNDDCPSDKTCVNQKCASPCTLSDSCGQGSFCHSQNHQPVCRCPNGYTGDPRIACVPRKHFVSLVQHYGLFLNINRVICFFCFCFFSINTTWQMRIKHRM